MTTYQAKIYCTQERPFVWKKIIPFQGENILYTRTTLGMEEKHWIPKLSTHESNKTSRVLYSSSGSTLWLVVSVNTPWHFLTDGQIATKQVDMKHTHWTTAKPSVLALDTEGEPLSLLAPLLAVEQHLSRLRIECWSCSSIDLRSSNCRLRASAWIFISQVRI